MAGEETTHGTPRGASSQFADTHWSIVLAAKAEDTQQAFAALEKLCRTYWPPLYAYIRREGYGVEDAQDLTQEFLSRFVEKKWLEHLRHQDGKFRSFLLTFLKNFLSDQRDRATAQKRGGGRTPISIDSFEAEERSGIEPVDGLTPDQIYERRWAQMVMERAVGRLREYYSARDNLPLFEAIQDLQPGEHGERSYSEMGIALGMSEPAVKNAVVTFRRRYSAAVRNEITQTVGDPTEVKEEIGHLMRILGG